MGWDDRVKRAASGDARSLVLVARLQRACSRPASKVPAVEPSNLEVRVSKGNQKDRPILLDPAPAASASANLGCDKLCQALNSPAHCRRYPQLLASSISKVVPERCMKNREMALISWPRMGLSPFLKVHAPLLGKFGGSQGSWYT